MKINDKVKIFDGIYSRNRIGMPAMDTLMASDGFANEFHIQHYGARAYGGFGVIIVESTAISEEGKIREKDLGLWKDEHIDGLKSIVKIAKGGGSVIGVQLNHAGSKAEMENIDKIGTTFFYDYLNQKRLSIITESQIEKIIEKFVKAAHRAKEAGFDFIEIHGAHGYLLNQFMHPKLNEVIKSNDILKRAKIVVDIAKRISEEVKIPIGIRLSVVDHVEGGMNINEYKPLIKELEKYVNYFNVSSGETIGRSDIGKAIKDAGTPIFRIPLVNKIKEFTKKPLWSVGNISNRDGVSQMIDGNAEIALIGREAIFNPNFPLHILELEEMNKDDYHWNNNIWFNPHDYLKLMKDLKLK